MKHLLTAEKQESRRVFQDVQQFLRSPTTHFFRWNIVKCVVHSHSSYFFSSSTVCTQSLRFLSKEGSQVEEFRKFIILQRSFFAFLHFLLLHKRTTSFSFSPEKIMLEGINNMMLLLAGCFLFCLTNAVFCFHLQITIFHFLP